MKTKILSFFILILIWENAFTQEEVSKDSITTSVVTSKKEFHNPKLSFGGGAWFGIGKKVQFIGFLGPKLSTTFRIKKETTIEIGINGVPGLILDKNPRLGLGVGTMITLKHSRSKIKPTVGLIFIKTDKWQPIFGAGFSF